MYFYYKAEIVTILEDFSDAGPLVFAASVTLHIWKHSALVGPEIILGAKEEDWELSDLMAKVLDVGGDVSGVVDLCRPPSEEDTGQEKEESGSQHRTTTNTNAWLKHRSVSLTCTFPV